MVCSLVLDLFQRAKMMWKRTHYQAMSKLMATNYTLLILAKQSLSNTAERQVHASRVQKTQIRISRTTKNSINRYYEHLANNSIQIEPNNTNFIKEQVSPINLYKKGKKKQ